MILELYRVTHSPNSTQGLLAMDGINQFTTLEPTNPIAAATYHVIKQWSPKFQKMTPHLQNVPGHTAIEMHVGNWPKDTEDCILVGMTRSTDFIGDSLIAFNKLMAMTPDEFDLAIYEPPEAT